MGYSDKHSYDDMGRVGNSRRQGNGKMDRRSLRIIVSVVMFGVLLCAGVVVVWLLYFSSTEPKEDVAEPSLVVEPIERESGVDVVKSVAAEEGSSPQAQPIVVETPTPTGKPESTQHSDSIWYTEHVVASGETLDSISEKYGISKETILSVNDIRNLSSVREGTTLRIPDRDGQLYTVQSGDSLSIITNRFNPALGWKTLQELNGLKSEVIYPGQEIFIPSARVDDDGSLASYNRFVRPSEGRITGLYGQTVVYGNSENIVVLRGIWLEGRAGSPVVASATGVVVDVGNEVEGRGRFVVLSHEDGYRTTYAHLDSVSVKVGDPVKQKDTVGTMGSSGNIGKTALYFSIEQDGTALNPANFF
jgi:murein DD-endopeptidase MepM/ murein hydrolase activator NlpD